MLRGGVKSVFAITKNFTGLTSNMIRNSSLLSKAVETHTDDFKTLAVSSPKPFVTHVELNRPDKLNAFNFKMWMEIKKCFQSLATDPNCRVIVLSAAGKHFSAGIDLKDMLTFGQELAEIDDVARKSQAIERFIKIYQDSISSLELCPKPVIIAIHSACVGAGLNLASTADIRYCSEDAWFQLKEVEIGMAADVGALQRLPKSIGSQSVVRELCFTARKFYSEEAKDIGFVNKIFPDKDTLIAGVFELAETIAEKSPVAVQATKQNMIYSLDHTNQEGLDHVRNMNKTFLQSEDFTNAVGAQITKSEKPVFSKL